MGVLPCYFFALFVVVNEISNPNYKTFIHNSWPRRGIEALREQLRRATGEIEACRDVRGNKENKDSQLSVNCLCNSWPPSLSQSSLSTFDTTVTAFFSFFCLRTFSLIECQKKNLLFSTRVTNHSSEALLPVLAIYYPEWYCIDNHPSAFCDTVNAKSFIIMPAIQAVGSPRASPGASASYDRVGSFSTAADDPDSSGGITSFLGFNSNGRLSPVRALLRDPRITGFYQEHCTYLPAMSGWFLFSSLLSTYNKYVFGEKHLDFPCPLLLTSMHFWTQWGFSWSMCKLFPTLFGSKTVDDMTWREFLEISIPCGLVTSGDIGLSNLSMVTISLTFYTMVKASSPIFVLFWAYFFGIMEIKWTLCLVVLVICVGEFLTVMGEVDFVVKGFAMCLMATCLSGARWTLVQLKIQALDPPLKTTVATMRVLSPFMALSMTFVALALEQPWYSLRSVIDSWATLFNVLMLGFMGASLAICMIMCEFFLIMHSNAIVLMIGGVIKEILTIFIG